MRLQIYYTVLAYISYSVLIVCHPIKWHTLADGDDMQKTDIGVNDYLISHLIDV